MPENPDTEGPTREGRARLRLAQCPGCWSTTTVNLFVAPDWECECGERLTVIDLREQPAGSALTALKAAADNVIRDSLDDPHPETMERIAVLADALDQLDASPPTPTEPEALVGLIAETLLADLDLMHPFPDTEDTTGLVYEAAERVDSALRYAEWQTKKESDL